MKERIITVVEWDDAWQDQENFTSAHGIAQTHRPMKLETIGLIVQDDEAGISVVNEECPSEQTYRGRTFIPRAMIKRVTHYKLVKPRKTKPPETPP